MDRDAIERAVRHPLFPARVVLLSIGGLLLGAVLAATWQVAARADPVVRLSLDEATDTQMPAISAARSADAEAPLIVLDPGHGGFDPGASAGSQVVEKDIALAIAKALRDRLLALGGVRVALTRHDDSYLPLAERVAIAEALEADLFVSIHADSLPEGEARGSNIYTLSLTASDREAGRLARALNAGDSGEGNPLSQSGEVEEMLADLTRRRIALASADVASALSGRVEGAFPVHAPLRRSGDFVVLRSSQMPSILFEAGYISDPDDAARLSREEGQQAIADALAEGLVAALLAPRG